MNHSNNQQDPEINEEDDEIDEEDDEIDEEDDEKKDDKKEDDMQMFQPAVFLFLRLTLAMSLHPRLGAASAIVTALPDKLATEAKKLVIFLLDGLAPFLPDLPFYRVLCEIADYKLAKGRFYAIYVNHDSISLVNADGLYLGYDGVEENSGMEINDSEGNVDEEGYNGDDDIDRVDDECYNGDEEGTESSDGGEVKDYKLVTLWFNHLNFKDTGHLVPDGNGVWKLIGSHGNVIAKVVKLDSSTKVHLYFTSDQYSLTENNGIFLKCALMDMLSITERPQCSKCKKPLPRAHGAAESDLCPTCWRLNSKRKAEAGGAGDDGAGNNAGDAAGGDGRAAGV
jgi:hypothetical protein